MPLEISEDDLRIGTCPRCRGERKVWDPPEPVGKEVSFHVPCPECGGRGVRLTATGARLFDFIRDVMRPR